MSKKYQIGQTYLLKMFGEPEEMEYLGAVKSKQLNGSRVNIEFDVFRRYFYGKPDLIVVYNDEFFTRSHDNSVEGLVKAIGNAFSFYGKGHTTISINDVKLSIDEFKEQTKNLLTEAEIEETISSGRYFTRNRGYGEIKWCPNCKKIRQTTCSACGCGDCKNCAYRWVCYGFIKV